MNSRVLGTRPLLSALISMGLAACSTARVDYQRDLQSYVGDTESELVKRLGPAEQRIEQPGETILVYRPISYQVPLGVPAPITSGNPEARLSLPQANSVTSASGQKLYANCRVSFHVRNGLIRSWTAQGPECPKTLLNR